MVSFYLKDKNMSLPDKELLLGLVEGLGRGAVMAKGHKISFWGDENSLKLIVMFAQLWGYTKNL